MTVTVIKGDILIVISLQSYLKVPATEILTKEDFIILDINQWISNE